MTTQPPQPRSDLAKLATAFAVVFGIAFGLCTASATFGMDLNEKAATFFIWISAATEAICLLGLLVTGVIAISRAMYDS